MRKRKKRVSHRDRMVAFKLTKEEFKKLEFFAKMNELSAPKWARVLALANMNSKVEVREV